MGSSLLWYFAAILYAIPIFACFKLLEANRLALLSKRLMFQSLRAMQKFGKLESNGSTALIVVFLLHTLLGIKSIFSLTFLIPLLFGYAVVVCPLFVYHYLSGKPMLVLPEERSDFWKRLIARKGSSAYRLRYGLKDEKQVDAILGEEWKSSGEIRRILKFSLAPFLSFESEMALCRLRVFAYSVSAILCFAFGIFGCPALFLWWVVRLLFRYVFHFVLGTFLYWAFRWVIAPFVMAMLWKTHGGNQSSVESESDDRRRVVLVTGASKGIGKALAKLFVRDEFPRVILVARTEKDLVQTREEFVKQFGDGEEKVTIDVLSADLGTREGLEKVYQSVDRVDVLVNNAGLGQIGRFAEADPEVLRGMCLVNVAAVVSLTRHYLPGMIERNYGRILMVGSIVGELPWACEAVYVASKTFIHAFARILRFELANQYEEKKNIYVTVLAPGWTNTEFCSHAFRGRAPASMTLPQFVKIFRDSGMPVDQTDVVAEAGFRSLFQNVGRTIPGPALVSVPTMMPWDAMIRMSKMMLDKVFAKLDGARKRSEEVGEVEDVEEEGEGGFVEEVVVRSVGLQASDEAD